MSNNKEGAILVELGKLAIHLDAEISEARLASYVSVLKDYPFEAIAEGIALAKKTCKYFPQVAELLELTGQKALTLHDQAVLAWTRLRKRSPSTQYHPSALTDPVINTVFYDMGGEQRFGKWNEEQEDFKRKEFLEIYKAKYKYLGVNELHSGKKITVEELAKLGRQPGETIKRITATRNPELQGVYHYRLKAGLPDQEFYNWPDDFEEIKDDKAFK